MMKLFYNGPNFKVKNNGWLSNHCRMERGIRQGCSLSALLFVIAVEVLAIMIRNDKNINGVTIGETEHQLAQYADDTTVFLKDTVSIKELLRIFRTFEKTAGLKLNVDKTKGIWLGKLKDKGLRILEGIHFTGNPVKCLGVYVGHNTQKCENKNWNEKLASLKRVIAYWQKMNLSIFARVKVIKTYLLSKIIFTSSLIPIPEQFLKDFKNMCYEFLWKGKRDKIKRSTVIAQMQDGGLGMIDIDSFILALRATWVTKLLTQTGNWRDIFNYYTLKLGIKEPAYMFNMSFKDIKQLDLKGKVPNFYIECC